MIGPGSQFRRYFGENQSILPLNDYSRKKNKDRNGRYAEKILVHLAHRLIFAAPQGRLAYSIMVVRQILVLFVLVRIQVGQQLSFRQFFIELLFLFIPFFLVAHFQQRSCI